MITEDNDDFDDFYSEEDNLDCDCSEYETDLMLGTAWCHKCQRSWGLTAEEVKREIEFQADYMAQFDQDEAPAPMKKMVATSDPIAWAEVYDGKIVTVQLDKSKWHTTPLYMSAPADLSVGLIEAAKEVIASASDTYKKRNGHLASFEDDSGEKCWIVPFDAFEGLRSATAALASTEGTEG